LFEPEFGPEMPFGIGHILAQRLGVSQQAFIIFQHLTTSEKKPSLISPCQEEKLLVSLLGRRSAAGGKGGIKGDFYP
jgi:hypothetical protein